MLSPDEIAEQQQLLAAHRRTLAVYLRQAAEIGRNFSPPSLINGIDDSRANIRRIKAALTAAGIDVPEDPDDEEPPPPPPPRLVRPPSEVDASTSQASAPAPLPALPAQGGAPPPWLWPALAGVLALVLVAGVAWALLRPPGETTQEDTPAATADQAADAPTAEAAPAGEAPTAEAAPTDSAALEGQLADANIELSAVQVDEVRKFINDPETPYRELAEHALQVVGDQKFRQPLYLDELDTRYTDLVGTEHYRDYDPERLKEAMVRAWNEHYTDQQVDSYDEIVEGR
jgi:hypothetical protein